MIEVRDLRHVYNTKSKNKVLALKGVSCTFETKGMCFIVGKSGCGKSTFLNLLGGLDKISIGDVLVDGVSMKSFSQSEYDSYRASYVGIIFQEFNLLEELTVFQNIELQLNIAGITATPEMIEESLTKVGLSGYGERLPYELSGGERQRVAIARQLAKGAKLLLADEPTGNLDSGNAENVFQILKELSKEIAVVVVSHDLDFANRYADKIITMKDGVIESVQNKTEIASDNEEKSVYKSIKPKFPPKYVGKFAIKNIFKRKIRFTISLILSFLACAMFCILGSVLKVDSDRSLSDKLFDDNVPYYQFIQGIDYNGNGNINVEADRKNVSYINQYNIENKYSPYTDFLYQRNIKFGTPYYTITTDRYSPTGIFWHGNSYIEINSAEDIKNILGYAMIGEYLPLDIQSAYITDYYAIGLIRANSKYIDGDANVALNSDAKIEDLIGKIFVMEIYPGSSATLKVAGILKTDYEKFGFIEKYEELQALVDKSPNGNVQYSTDDMFTIEELAMKKLYCSLFVNDEWVNKIASAHGSLKFAENGVIGGEGILFLENDGFFVNGKNFSIDVRPVHNFVGYYELLYTADGFQYLSETEDISLEDNEIYLSKSDYEKFFGEKLNNEDYYYTEWVDTYPGGYYTYPPKNVVPPRVGETITLCLNYESIGKKIEKEVVVKGVLFKESPEMQMMGITYISDEFFSELANESNTPVSKILMKKAETREESLEYAKFFSEYTIFADSDYTQDIIFTELTLIALRTLFLVFGSAFLVISMLMFINYISSVVSDSKKNIGIIRAIGGTSWSIFKIYYALGVIFYLITSVFYIASYVIALPLLNKVFAKGVLTGVQFLYFTFPIIGLVAVLLFVSMTLASLIPIIKVSKKSPIEAIRKV